MAAKAHVYTLNNALSDLVTKDDLKTEIGHLEAKIDAKFDTIDARFSIFQKWGGTILGGIFLLVLKVAIWG